MSSTQAKQHYHQVEVSLHVMATDEAEAAERADAALRRAGLSPDTSGPITQPEVRYVNLFDDAAKHDEDLCQWATDGACEREEVAA